MEYINIRIARELNRIAKSLIAGDDIADHPGSYTHFTGIIDFKNNYATVKNATFKLDNYGIDWQDGIWLDGIWQNGDWQDGTWKNGDWKNGFWHDGTWEDGEWWNGIWYDGNWQDGVWRCGSWKNGTWNNGEWWNGTWNNGVWRNGNWKKGNWIKGTWQNGKGRMSDEEIQDYFNVLEKKYIQAYKHIPGVKDAKVDDYNESISSIGRKYWFTVYFETNQDQNRHRLFTKRLDYLENAITKATIKPDVIENIYMPTRKRYRDNYSGKQEYYYDQDYATVEIFIYNKDER